MRLMLEPDFDLSSFSTFGVCAIAPDASPNAPAAQSVPNIFDFPLFMLDPLWNPPAHNLRCGGRSMKKDVPVNWSGLPRISMTCDLMQCIQVGDIVCRRANSIEAQSRK